MESNKMKNPQPVSFSFTREVDFPAGPSGGDGDASPRAFRRSVTCRVTADESGPQATARQTELFVEDRLVYRVRRDGDRQLTGTVFCRFIGGAFEEAEHSFTGRCDEPGVFLSCGSAFLYRMACSLVPGAEEDGDEAVCTSEAEARAAAGASGRVVPFLAVNGREEVPRYLVLTPAWQEVDRILGWFMSANNLLRRMEHPSASTAALLSRLAAQADPLDL